MRDEYETERFYRTHSDHLPDRMLGSFRIKTTRTEAFMSCMRSLNAGEGG